MEWLIDITLENLQKRSKYSKKDAFFKEVVESQKAYAKKVMAYLLLNSPDYGMAYRHHFGEPTKAI